MEIDKELRKKIFTKYYGRCAYCGIELDKHFTVEHIVPKINGGSDHESNLNPSCRSCNAIKCDNTIEDMREVIKNSPSLAFKNHTKYRTSLRYGLIKETEIDVKFYFEKVNQYEPKKVKSEE